jgi:hypothetical protein
MQSLHLPLAVEWLLMFDDAVNADQTHETRKQEARAQNEVTDSRRCKIRGCL